MDVTSSRMIKDTVKIQCLYFVIESHYMVYCVQNELRERTFG